MSRQRSIAPPDNDRLFSARTFATWRRASTNAIRRSTQVASPTRAIMVDQIPVPIAPATRGSA